MTVSAAGGESSERVGCDIVKFAVSCCSSPARDTVFGIISCVEMPTLGRPSAVVSILEPVGGSTVSVATWGAVGDVVVRGKVPSLEFY